MNFDFKKRGRPSTRDKSLIKLPKSPAIMSSGISTKFLSSDRNDLCDRLDAIVQEKKAANNFDIVNDELFAIDDKLLEYKCISKKQHKQILIKSNLLHTNKN